ncbi:MAG: TraM recognition domain-containing protein [Blautia sp.]|nr:TraM recognition domain-containing protein [Blautia sp.]MBR2798583.1 TraM recognition domain-containing protein [Clostridia bacterium]
MNTKKLKKIIIKVLPYALIGLVCTNLGEAWRLAEGADASKKLLSFFSALGVAFGNPLPSFHPADLLVGAVCGGALYLAVYLRHKNAKHFKHNQEYGSARWGNHADIEPFMDPIMFENLEKKNPKHFAVRQYKKYKLAAGKTAKSILISCGARLAVFDIQELREITAYDELELDTIGDRKTALFLIMSDTDATFNFLISMIYTQLFNLLCEKADDVYGGRLPVHVRCLIDEAANIGQIPNLEKLVATIRSREISACLVLQARSQLKAIYKDNADTIIGNMDSQVFLGGSEPTTLKELAEALGKETIDTFNTSDTRGNSPSYGTNYQKLGKELMSRDELAVMNGSKCVLQLRGVRPFLSDKYDITQHPNYRYTSDYDKKYTFDIEKYLNRRMKLRAEDEYDVIEA